MLYEVLYQKKEFVERTKILCKKKCRHIIKNIPIYFYVEYLNDKLLNKVSKFFDPKIDLNVFVHSWYDGCDPNSSKFINKIVKCNYTEVSIKDISNVIDFDEDSLKYSDIKKNKNIKYMLAYNCHIPVHIILESLSKKYNKNIDDIVLKTVKYKDEEFCILPVRSHVLFLYSEQILFYNENEFFIDGEIRMFNKIYK